MIQKLRFSLIRPLVTVVALLVFPTWIPGGGISLSQDAISDGQWYVKELKLESAHRIASGRDVIVAVIDSGVDASHPVLVGSVLPGADFSTSNSQSTSDGRFDDDGHGTGMASLIVGHDRISGVAPAAKILPVRVAGNAMRTNFAAGIQWAVDHGARVINISAGAPLADPREKQAIDDAIRHDVVVVAAVGNAPQASSVQYPARYAGVLAVGATSRNGARSSVSTIGPEIAISAPGERISAARLHHGYAIATGTSDATAIVSGVVALVRSRFPSMNANDVIRRLTATAIDAGPPGRDSQFGFGIVDPVAALAAPTVSADASAVTATTSSQLGGPSPARAGGFIWYLALLSGIGILTLLVVAVVAMMLFRSRG